MLSADQLRRIARSKSMPKFAEAYAAAAVKYMAQHGITTIEDIAAFWATVAVETGGYRIIEENMNYSAKRMTEVWPSRFKTIKAAEPYAGNPQKLANKVYGGRASLGNKGKPDAGWLYRGSGPMQTTGYVNYKLSEDATGIPLTTDPDILRRHPDVGMRAACIFWEHKKISAAANAGDIRRVRKLVNGGYIGWDDFKAYHDRIVALIKKEGLAYSVDDAGEPVEIDLEPELERNPSSPILPLYRPKQSDDVTRAVLKKHDFLLPPAPVGDPVQVLFVRGYYLNSMGAKGKNDRAIYDDAVFVVSPEGVQPFNGNSDPSAYRKRIASIKGHQSIRYRPGLHGYSRKNGPYKAFRQDANCTVVRDGVGEETGMFHVNLHRGGVNGTSSLGCLTIPPHQWDEFRDLLNGLLEKHGQKTFRVTLLEYEGGKPPVEMPSKGAPVFKGGSSKQPAKPAGSRPGSQLKKKKRGLFGRLFG